MKKIKINKCLCLLIVTIFSIAFMTSLTVFAVHLDGSTEVIAHIESTTAEATDAVVDDNSISVTYDETDISTGYIISGCVIIAFLLLAISFVVIYLCQKNNQYGNCK